MSVKLTLTHKGSNEEKGRKEDFDTPTIGECVAKDEVLLQLTKVLWGNQEEALDDVMRRAEEVQKNCGIEEFCGITFEEAKERAKRTGKKEKIFDANGVVPWLGMTSSEI